MSLQLAQMGDLSTRPVLEGPGEPNGRISEATSIVHQRPFSSVREPLQYSALVRTALSFIALLRLELDILGDPGNGIWTFGDLDRVVSR